MAGRGGDGYHGERQPASGFYHQAVSAAMVGSGWLVPTAATDFEATGLAAAASTAGVSARETAPLVSPPTVLGTGSGMDAWAVAAAEAVHRGALMRGVVAGGGGFPRTARTVVAAQDHPERAEVTAAAWIRGGDGGASRVHAHLLHQELLASDVRHAGTVRPRQQEGTGMDAGAPPARRRRASLEGPGGASGSALAFPVIALDDAVPGNGGVAGGRTGAGAASPRAGLTNRSSIAIFDDFSSSGPAGAGSVTASPPARSALSPRETIGGRRSVSGWGQQPQPSPPPAPAAMVAVPVVTPASAIASPGSWRRGVEAFALTGAAAGAGGPRAAVMGLAPAVFSPPRAAPAGGPTLGRGLAPGAAGAAAAASGVARAVVAGGPSTLLLSRTDEDGPEDTLQSVVIPRAAVDEAAGTAAPPLSHGPPPAARPAALQRGFGAAAALAGGPALRHAAAQALPAAPLAAELDNDNDNEYSGGRGGGGLRASPPHAPPAMGRGIGGAATSVLGLRDVSAALLRAPPRALDRVSPIPFRVLDAPGVANDYYLHVLDWSSRNQMAIALGAVCYLWDGYTNEVTELDESAAAEAQPGSRLAGIAFSGSGDYLAVSGDSGPVRIYDAHTRTLLRTLTGHTQQAASLSWAGPVLATGSKDRQIILRDVREPAHSFATLAGAHGKEVCALKWSPDWEMIASGGNDNAVKVWSVKRLPSARKAAPPPPGSAASGAATRRPASAANNAAATAAAAAAAARYLQEHPSVDEEEAAEAELYAALMEAEAAAAAAEEAGAAARGEAGSEGEDDELLTASTAEGSPSSARGSGRAALRPRFDAAWAGSRVEPVWSFEHQRGAARALCWSPHQRGILVSGGGTYDRCVRVYSTSLCEQLAFVDTGSQVTNILWGWDPSRFAVTLGFNQNAVTVWNYPSLTLGTSLTGHTSRVLYATLGSDQETVVTAAPAPDETIRFWHVFPRRGGARDASGPAPGDIGDELEMPGVDLARGGGAYADASKCLLPVRRNTTLAARLFATAAPTLLGLQPSGEQAADARPQRQGVGFSGSATFASAASPPPGIR